MRSDCFEAFPGRVRFAAILRPRRSNRARALRFSAPPCALLWTPKRRCCTVLRPDRQPERKRMMPGRRALIFAACGLFIFASPLSAQNYPNGPIRLLVGFAAGGSSDVLARSVAKALSEGLGQSVVVEN